MSRLAAKFAELKAQNQTALIAFITGGDPNYAQSLKAFKSLPQAGVDIIELGIPFSDPMADGPAIQAASLRALEAGMNLSKILDMVREFRKENNNTPLVLMGYYNPVYAYGPERFAKDAGLAGIDGVILVDLPPEEADELLPHLKTNGIDFIFLTAPTTLNERLPLVLSKASGFVYYVSVTGVTGTSSASEDTIKAGMERLRAHTQLPLAAGFGINTPEQAGIAAKYADAVVVGSAIVKTIHEKGLEAGLLLAQNLASALHQGKSK